MDLSLMTATMPPASAELPDARGTLKGDDASLLPFELALLSELQLLTPACDLPVEAGAEAGEGADLLDALTTSDPWKGGLPDLPASLLPAAELVAQPSAPASPQLILPPLAMQPAPLRAEQLGVATSPTSTPATVASAMATSASLVPMAMAQLRTAEPAATAPSERGNEKSFARLTPSAAHASAAPTAVPGEEVLEAPRALPGAPTETLAHAQPESPSARPRVSAWPEESSADKLPVRGESTPQARAIAIPAEVERTAIRVEQPIAAEVVRQEAPAALAPTASSSPTPASAFTSPTSQYTAPQPPAAVTAHIQTPFGHTEWAEQFREKVVWLVDRQQQTAELHIHPPHLGPVEVMLTLNDDRTSVAFVSPHPAVREAIEASFPDLRATLEERGLALGHASVSADSKDAREQLPQDAQHGRRLPGSLLTAEESHMQRRVLLQRGLVDTFA